MIVYHSVYPCTNSWVTAKKIPIEHILAATRGATRPGTTTGRANGSGQASVDLDENANKPKDACNC